MENCKVARRGGEVAGVARKALEEQTGVPVVTSMKASDFHSILTSIIEAAPALIEEKEEESNE
ncbi:hypothetical protein F170042I7_00330 [Blautia caecimuris]|uniref:hypothetical protein n=1 Tax=Blautia caecimuris TaxID=1796615 RepID=UPI0034AC7D7A